MSLEGLPRSGAEMIRQNAFDNALGISRPEFLDDPTIDEPSPDFVEPVATVDQKERNIDGNSSKS